MKSVRSYPKQSLAFASLFLLVPILGFGDPGIVISKGKVRKKAHHVPGQYIVILKPRAHLAMMGVSTLDFAKHLSTKHHGKIKTVFKDVTHGFVMEMKEPQAMELAQNDLVEF